MSNSAATGVSGGSVSASRFGYDSYADHVGSRMLEFFADSTPWQRRLWDAGSVLALREVHDAADWADRRVLSSGAVAWLARDVWRLVGRDRGVGSSELRRQLAEVLRSTVQSGSRRHRQLRELTDLAEDGYLSRWIIAVDSGQRPSPERLSRAIAAHLLDNGYSTGYLHRWARGLYARASSIADLMAGAESLAARGDESYEVLVPCVSVPRHDELAVGLPTWRSAVACGEWLARRGGAPRGVRQNGGFLFSVRAKDPYGAADLAALIVERMVARSSFARSLGGRLEPLGRVWVGDQNVEVPLRKPHRGAYVLSLESERRLYSAVDRTALDDALELAAPLNQGAPGPAVAGGWAAIEALLVEPRDPEDSKEGRGAVAADRLAALVTCSWPRSELTTLSYRHRPQTPDRLSEQLKHESKNRERSRLVAEAIRGGRRLSLANPGDVAAQARMAALIDQPRNTLRDINHHMCTALRRLYRQRNIVVHGGSTGALALDVTLRTAAPLVGAGLDRITHAALTDGTSPPQLAERAAMRLKLVGGDGGHHVADLLE